TFKDTQRYPEYTGGARAFTRGDTNHFALSRIDFGVGSKVQVNTSWIWTPQRQTGALPNADPRIAAPSNDLTIQGGWQPANAYTAAVNYTVTPSILLSARYGYKYQNDKIGNYGLPLAPYIVYQQRAPAEAPLQGNTGFSNVSSTLTTEKDIQTRHNVYLDG